MPNLLLSFVLSTLLACGTSSDSSASTPPGEAPPIEAPAPSPGAPAVPDAAGVRSVDVAGLKAAVERGGVPVLVDVRTPEEFGSGHVPGAVNIPLDKVKDRMGELVTHRDGDVYLICLSGGRSRAASEILASEGFHPINVDGGTRAWQKAGYPVE